MKKIKFLGVMLGLVVLALASSAASALAGPIAAGVVAFSGLATMTMQLTGGMPSGALFSLINFAGVTFSGKEVMTMTEAIMTAVNTNPELTSVHSVAEGIVAEQQIVFLGVLSKITKKKESCGGTPTAKEISTSQKTWNPTRVRFWLQQCADSLEETFFVWGLNKGIDRKDLTNTDYSEFLMQRIEEALVEDVMRIAWFNDKDHELIADGGRVTDALTATGLEDYTIIDGLWKQIYAIVGGDASRKTAIARNALTTYATQKFLAIDTTNKVVMGIFADMVDNMDPRLYATRGKGLTIWCTSSVYKQYKKELESYGSLESAWIQIQEGVKSLSYDGIPVVPIDFWDRTIRADFDTTTAWYQPHRVVITVKENIPIGIDGTAELSKVKQFFDDMTETNNWKGGYKIDAKVLENHMIQVAY